MPENAIEVGHAGLEPLPERINERYIRLLLDHADAWCAATGKTLAYLGKNSCGNNRIFRELLDPDRSLRLDTFDRITDYIRSTMPKEETNGA